MMMRSEVVGRHETVEERRMLASQLSIWGLCHEQHVAYEERPNPAAETNVLLEGSLIAHREPMQIADVDKNGHDCSTMQPESLMKRLQPACLQCEQVGMTARQTEDGIR